MRSLSSSTWIFFFFPFFFSNEEKVFYSYNKNKSVLYFTIYFKYFHYEVLISPTQSISVQHFQKTSVTGTLRRDNLHSHTSPLFQPRPQMTTRQCIQKSISVSCSSVAHSTAQLNILLYILVSIPSWSSDTQRTLAAFGSNLGFVPLDKRFLQTTTCEIRHRHRSKHGWHC